MGRMLASSLAVALCCASAAGATASQQRPLRHVTIFGDSVAAVLTWDPTAVQVLEQGDRLTLDLVPCGRLVQPGCLLVQDPPPSVLREIELLGRRIGPTAVVLVGYNDDPHVYATGIGKVLSAMHRRGVRHVLWLTLRAINQQYRLINEVIHGASARSRWMTVLDWNAYARNHPSWFATDGIHLSSLGGVQLAIFIHRSLKRMHLTGPLPAPGQ
ncbi:MAG TPA: hypothetical protein VFU30_11690 [Gaiellaceae bacterium]|nr:hypothetical protein [Gaiellaceae bacterium]